MNKKFYFPNIMEPLNNDNFKKIFSLLEDGYKGLFVILKVINSQHNEVIAGDISKKLNISTARVAVALNTLEKKQYIIKRKSDNDLRKTVVELTPLGEAALLEREKKIQEVIESILECLNIEEQQQLFNILKKIGSQTI